MMLNRRYLPMLQMPPLTPFPPAQHWWHKKMYQIVLLWLQRLPNPRWLPMLQTPPRTQYPLGLLKWHNTPYLMLGHIQPFRQ